MKNENVPQNIGVEPLRDASVLNERYIPNEISSAFKVDDDLYDIESAKLKIESNRARPHFNSAMRRTKNIDEWIRLDKKRGDLSEFSSVIFSKLEKIYNGETENTSYQLMVLELLYSSTFIARNKIHTSFRKKATKENFPPEAIELLDFVDFNSRYMLASRLGDCTLEDIFNGQYEDGTSVKCGSVLDYFSIGRYASRTKLKDKTEIENKNALSSEYPELAKDAIFRSISDSINLNSLIQIDQIHDRTKLLENSPIEREVSQTAKELMKKLKNYYKKIEETLKNPDAVEFPHLRDTILKHLTKNRLSGLNLVSGFPFTTIKEVYRFAQNNEREQDFYNLLSEYILDLVELSQEALSINTHNDISLFTEESTSYEELKDYSINDIKVEASKIVALTGQKNFNFVKGDINIEGLIDPDTTSVEFDVNSPSKIDIEFNYTAENEISKSIRLRVDTKKQQIDWNFLESMDDPKMVEFKKLILNSTITILKQISTEQESLKKSRQAIEMTPQREVKIKRTKPETLDDNAELKRKRNQSESPLANTSFDQAESEFRGIKNHIIIPKSEEFTSLVKSLSYVDRQIVEDNLLAFNQGENKGLKMLARTLPDGSKQFSIRINTVSGGVRVLLKMDDSSESGIRKFTMHGIGYRKDIYRKRGI